MPKLKYIVVSFALFSNLLSAQFLVNGKVICANQPVPFASVGIKQTAEGVSSNSIGEFVLPCKTGGVFTLLVSAIGYEKLEKKIVISDSINITIVLTKIENALDEVVISGTLKEISRSESPIVIDIITPKLFQKNPTRNLFEAIQMVNGVQPQINCSVCNTGDIHINGMEGPYTMITIDGMPIVSGLSTVYGLSGIPNSLINRIEVVKGPASTLYGSEAVAGLINVITKSPETASLLSLDLFASSQQEYNVDIGLKFGKKKVSSLLGINYFNFNNRIDNNSDGFTDITLQNRISVFNKYSLSRKKNRVFSLAGRFVYEDRFGGEMSWIPKFRGTDSIYGESIYTSRYELIGNYELPVSREKIFLQFSFNNHNQNSYYGITPYMANQTVAFAQLLWNKPLNEVHDLTIGTPFRYTVYDDNTTATHFISVADTMNAPQKVQLPGIFIQDQYTISEKSTLLGGLRYDFNLSHGHIITPRINFKYSFNKSNVMRMGGGNGYRVVNLFTEDHAALTGSRTVEIVNSLKPEKSWNFNWSYQYSEQFKNGFYIIDGGVFYTYFTNKIIPDYNSDPQKIIYDNIKGYAISRGVNLNMDVSFSNSLKILAGVTFMDVYSMQYDSLNKLHRVAQLFAPGLSGNFTVSYKIPKWDVILDYTGIVKGPMYLPVVPSDFRSSVSPWFSIQNIQLSKKIKLGWEFYAGVKNILNFLPKDPILRPFDPFDKQINSNNPYGYTFDTSYNYSSMQGLRFFVGCRYSIK